MTIGIRQKEWDSEFFCLNVAEAILSDFSESNLIKFVETLKKGKYSLVYIYPQDIKSYELLINNKIPLVDKKVSFQKNVKISSITLVKEIQSYRLNKEYPKLLELAYASGEYSRFKLDTNFEISAFENLYKTWLDNSINKKIADDVLVWCSEKNEMLGFITYKIKNSILKIGLLAVDKNARGYGVGKALMQHIEYIAYNNKLSIIEVDTQENNQIACAFYKNIGYKVHKTQSIFHLWLK